MSHVCDQNVTCDLYVTSFLALFSDVLIRGYLQIDAN